MIKNITSLLIIIVTCCLSANTHSGEYTLDLNLKDKRLSHFEYTPKTGDLDIYRVFNNWALRSYYVFYPRDIKPSMPVLIALHGAGRTGASMIDTWRLSAEKHSFIIIAPNGLFNNWSIERDESDFISEILNDTLVRKNITSNNIYLFGHSNGGKQALVLASTHPQMFSAVAAHAGTLPLQLKKQETNHKNKDIRVALFLGDSDHIFSINSGRQTVHWMSSIGIDSNLYILKNHTHWYYSESFKINERIWMFFEKNT